MESYKCLACGRSKFVRPYQPHICNGQFRKHAFPAGFVEIGPNDKPTGWRKMNIFNAIKLAHAGRTKEIEVVRSGSLYKWTDQSWSDYQNYVKAQDYLYDNHPLILRFLRWIKFV